MSDSSSEIPINLKATLNLITGGVSALAGLWVFHFYSKTPKPRSVSLKLILWLSIADFLYSTANIISAFDTTSSTAALCNFEGRLRVFSLMSGLIWSTCIAILSYQSFLRGKDFDQDLFFKNALIVGFLVPIFISIIPDMSAQYDYGLQKYGCYIAIQGPKTHLNELILVLLFDGFPVLLALALNLIIYALIAKRIHDMSKDLIFTHDIEIRRLFWYPAVIFLAYITSFVDNLIEIYLSSAAETMTFTCIHIILTHSVGLTNAIVYGMQRKKYYDVYGLPESTLDSKEIAMASYNNDLNGSNINNISAVSSCEGELIQAKATFTVF